MSQEAPRPLPPQIVRAQTLGYAPPVPRNDLRTIALRQKAIMYCILGYVVCGILNFVLPFPVNAIAGLGVLAAMIAGAVFVFMLSLALYSTGTGIVLGILTLVPLVGLIVLLIINGRATNELKQHGIKVGLMGARMDQIPSPGVPIQ